ncbi:MAG: hypothetical protein GXP45_06380 [bacterium]|nr:hypothetical protein [bacterium]
MEDLFEINKEDLSYIIRSMEGKKLIYFLNAGLSEQLLELFKQDNHHSDHSEIENAIKFLSWSKPLRIKKLLQTKQYKQLIPLVRTLPATVLHEFSNLIDNSIETVKNIFSASNEINIEEYLMNLPTASIKEDFLKGLLEFHA